MLLQTGVLSKRSIWDTNFIVDDANANELCGTDTLKNKIKGIFSIFRSPAWVKPIGLGAKNWSLIQILSRTVRYLCALWQRCWGKKDVTIEPILPPARYQYYPEKKLNSAELYEYFPMAVLSAAVTNPSENLLKRLEMESLNLNAMQLNSGVFGRLLSADPLFENITMEKNCFLDAYTGLKVSLVAYKDEPKKLFISFGDLHCFENTVSNDEENDRITASQKEAIHDNLLGRSPKLFTQAHALVKALLNSEICKDTEVVFTGQGLGGALSNYVALQEEKKAVIFNPLPLGIELQNNIGETKIKRALELVTAISVEGDCYSNQRASQWMEKALEVVFNLRLPGIFARRLEIPSAFPKDKKISHSNVLGSVAQHLGYLPHLSPEVICLGQSIISEIENKVTASKIDDKEKRLIKNAITNIINRVSNADYPTSLFTLIKPEKFSNEALIFLSGTLRYLKITQGDSFNFNKLLFGVSEQLTYRYQQITESEQRKQFKMKLRKTYEKIDLRLCPSAYQLCRMLDSTPSYESNIFRILHNPSKRRSKKNKKAHYSFEEISVDKRPVHKMPIGKLRILHNSLEYRNASVGGIASVTSSLLPKQISRGHDVRIVTPFYDFLLNKFDHNNFVYVGKVTHRFRKQMVTSTIYKVKNGLSEDGKPITHYLVQPDPVCSTLFELKDEKNIYCNYLHSGSTDRISYFNAAVAAMAAGYKGKKTKKQFHILHSHAWHNGLSNILMNKIYNPLRHKVGLAPIKTVFNVHLLSEEQGIISNKYLKGVGLKEFGLGHSNIHREAHKNSDYVLHVARATARAACSKDKGYGNHDVSSRLCRKGRLRGITNGINTKDFDVYNKKIVGPFAPAIPFDQMNDDSTAIVDAKGLCKEQLYKQGFLASPTKPLFTYVGRFSGEKGIDVLKPMIEKACELGGQVVLMGVKVDEPGAIASMKAIEQMVASKQLPVKIYYPAEQNKLIPMVGAPLGKLVRWATDITMVPSHFESCGLVPPEMFCMGSLVVTSGVQGLQDTCGPLTRNGESYDGNAFIYKNDAFKSANAKQGIVNAYMHLMQIAPEERNKLLKRLIENAASFDWNAPCGALDQFDQVYWKLVSTRT